MASKICTLDEYTQLVYEYCEKNFQEDFAYGLKEYLTTDEALKEIKHAYDYDVKRFKNGEMTEKQFRIGSVSSVAYCLYMMR